MGNMGTWAVLPSDYSAQALTVTLAGQHIQLLPECQYTAVLLLFATEMRKNFQTT